MDAVRGGAEIAARERRLADLHPTADPEEIHDAVSYCRRAEKEAEICAEQVREGRMTRDSAAACLAEQFPDLDTDQLRATLGRAIGASHP